MNLTNKTIYEYGKNLSIFNNCNLKMPVRINFYLQKNIQLILQAAKEIEEARLNIGLQFGTPNEEGTGFNIPSENIETVNHEIIDLFNLEQDIPLHIFKLDDFNGIELSYQEMSAIMFMIEE